MDRPPIDAAAAPSRPGLPAGGGRGGTVLGIGVGIGIAVAVAANLLPAAFARWVVATWASRAPLPRGTLVGDRDAIASWAGGGNVALRFHGFDPASDRYPAQLYFHLNYDLCPSRAFVGDAPSVVNTAGDIARLDFAPDAAWLRRRGVSVAVDVVRTPAGVRLEAHRVAPPGTAGGGGSGE